MRLAILAFVNAGLSLGLAFGAPLSEVQNAAILGFVNAGALLAQAYFAWQASRAAAGGAG